MMYKASITMPNKPNNIFTRLLVLGTFVSLTKFVCGFLSVIEIRTAVANKTAKM